MPKVETQFGPIHYKEAGTGEPLVFVHGYLMGGDLWDEAVEILRKDFRCIAPTWPLGAHPEPMNADADLTPHGMAAIIDGFLAALDLRDVTLIGNDSGGAFSQVVVTRHPERVGRLVLTSCDAFDNFPPSFFKAFGPVAKTGALPMTIASQRLKPNRALPIAYGWVTAKRPLPHDRIDGWVGAYLADKGVRRDLKKVTLGLKSKYTQEAAEKLHAFDKPVLLAWSMADKLFPFEHAQRLAAIFPDARIERIEDSRTWSMIDQPHRLAEAITAFVRETTPAQATA
jgi:pimeloyl-ACP methyl ester carboxylesterase